MKRIDRTSRALLFIVIQSFIFLSLAILVACGSSTTDTPVTTDTSTPCDSPTQASLPLELNGEGEFCYMTAEEIRNVNSTDTQLVEINGADYTNAYSDKMPQRRDGGFYIHYVGALSSSYLEVNGSVRIPVIGVVVDPTAMSLNLDTAAMLAAKVDPENATEKNISWQSSDPSIASVDAKGMVKSISEGTATITATTIDGGFKATVIVTVIQSTPNQQNHTLTIVTHGAGTTEPPSGTHTYAEGTTVGVAANAGNGYLFSGWSGAATGTENPVNITMSTDQTLTANFSIDNPLPDQCSSTCDNATPVHATQLINGGIGNVTMYSTEASSGGACNYGSTNIMHYAAIYSNIEPNDGQGRWQGGAACGHCAEVTVLTSRGLRSMVVRIVDECPDTNCGIDLGGTAPGDLMIDGFGRYEGKWRFVSCDGHPEVSDGPPSLDVFNGSNPWWSRVLVRNGSTAVRSIAWQAADGSKSGTFLFAQSPENTYEVPVNEVLQSGGSAFLITVNYVDGTTATVTLTPLELATPGSYPLD